MLKLTLRELKDGLTEEVEGIYQFVFLVRNNQDVFYVGKSETSNIVEVMQGQHLGRFYHLSRSVLAKVIRQNEPESDQWIIEILTREDTELLVTETQFLQFLTKHPKHLRSACISMSYCRARDALIWKWGPFLNRKKNPNRRQMPDVYGENPYWKRYTDWD